jgi:hypothetical protein
MRLGEPARTGPQTLNRPILNKRSFRKYGAYVLVIFNREQDIAMVKLRTFDITLTLAALAAVFLILPADREQHPIPLNQPAAIKHSPATTKTHDGVQSERALLNQA